MRIYYKDKKVERLCTDYSHAVKELGNTKLAIALATLMTDLKMFTHIKEFHTVAKLQKYRTHELTNNRRGTTSLRIDYKYRLILTVEVVSIGDIEDEVKIQEVTNHYE